MEDNSQQLNNLNDLNNVNNSQGQDLGNITPNNASDPYHEFEDKSDKSFNYTNLEEQFGVPPKKSSSNK